VEPAAGTADATAEGTTEGTAGSAPTWTIAQVAEEFAVTHRTVRHYEELGLITPERRGTTRVYHRRDRTRLALILRGKRSQLEYVLAQIDERRADLERRRRDLEEALAELTVFEHTCREDLARLR